MNLDRINHRSLIEASVMDIDCAIEEACNNCVLPEQICTFSNCPLMNMLCRIQEYANRREEALQC